MCGLCTKARYTQRACLFLGTRVFQLNLSCYRDSQVEIPQEVVGGVDLNLRGVGKARRIDMENHHIKGVVEVLEECIKTVFLNENPVGEFSRGWKYPYHL